MKAGKLLAAITGCGILLALMGSITPKESVAQNAKPVVQIHADYPYYPSIEALAEKADIIIEGSIVDSKVEEIDIRAKTGKESEKLSPGEKVPSSTFIYTVYTINVSDSYKGDIESGKTIRVKQLGGETKTAICMVDEAVKFANNKKYVMFLSDYGNDVPLSLLNPVQSIYTYQDEITNLKSTSLSSINKKNNLILTIKDLESIKNKYKK